MKRIGIILWLLCLSLAQAEQLRIVVGKPEVVAAGASTNGPGELAVLWQSLLSVELCKRDLFAVVEREDLPLLLQEWELAAGRQKANDLASAKPGLVGADGLLIGRMSLQSNVCDLTLKLLSAEQGTVEKEWTESFPPGAMEEWVRALAAQLQSWALGCLARRDIHTLVSVLDFEDLSPFQRSRWQERALARRVRGFMMKQPGVLVLEREDVNLLFEETRLRRGGLTHSQPRATDRWAKLANYFLISGTLNESQPEGQPLAFHVVAHVKNLAGDRISPVEEDFPAAAAEKALAHLENRVGEIVLENARPSATPSAPVPDHAAEAMVLANKVVRLVDPPHVKSLDFVREFGWELPPQFFGQTRHPFDNTPQRRATMLRTVQYLKTAQMLDEHNPLIKVLLSAVLADRQVNEKTLALELAEEIGWQFPEFQAGAWRFIFFNSTGAKSRSYRQLLMDRHAGSYEAKLAACSAMFEVIAAHQGDTNVTAGLTELRPFLEKAVAWARPTFLEAEVEGLWKFTQTTGRAKAERFRLHFELRDDANRAQGEQVLEALMAAHPQKAVYLSLHWAWWWDERTPRQDIGDRWRRRTIEESLKLAPDPAVIGLRVDPCRLTLAQRQMDQGRHKEALPLLEAVGNIHCAGQARFMIGQCAFALSDYARALKQFESLGPAHPDAGPWVRKCREKLGLPPAPGTARAYTVVTNTVKWRRCPCPLLPGVVSALKADGSEEAWIGLQHQHAGSEDGLMGLQSWPEGYAKALRQGGLIHWNRVTHRADYFKPGEGLPHPWITSLAVTAAKLCAGTLGGGVAILDKATGQWESWSETNGLPLNYVTSLDADGEDLWAAFGRANRGGVARYSFRARHWQSFLPGDYPGQTLPPTSCVQAVKVVAGRVWCSVPEQGTLVYQVNSNRWQRLPGGAFYVVDRVGDRLWFGHGSAGLASCNLAGDDWQEITPKDGLPMPPCILAEAAARLVIGTHGVMRLDPLRKEFEVFPLDVPPSFPGCPANSAMIVAGREVWLLHGQDGLRIMDLP